MDKSRVETAQAFDGPFYSSGKDNTDENTPATGETELLLEQLRKKPELLAALVKAASLLAAR